MLYVAWLISPIILLPLSIWALSKKNKLEGFLQQLLAEKRITLTEFYSKRSDRKTPIPPQMPPPYPPPETPQPPYGYPNPNAYGNGYNPPPGFTAYTPPPANEYSPFSAEPSTPAQDQPAAAQTFTPDIAAGANSAVHRYIPVRAVHDAEAPPPQTAQPTVQPTVPDFPGVPDYTRANTRSKPVRVKAERNPATVLLCIGTALIILAGIVFSKMTWLQMNDWQRTGIIALASAFFFAVSVFALKKLKLDNTSMAFYMIGSVFASITFMTAGFFGLMGSWLSTDGDGALMVYALAAVILTLLSARGVMLYKKGGFLNAALYGGLCSFTLLSMQMIDDREWWAFVLNIFAAVPIYLLYKNKLKTDTQYDSSLRLFAIIIAVFYGVAALPYMLLNLGSWTMPNMLTALVWLAQAVFYACRLGSGKLKYIHAAGTAFVLLQAVLMLPKIGSTFDSRTLILSCALFAAGLAYRMIPVLRTAFSDILYPAALFCCFINASMFVADIPHLTVRLVIALMLTALCLINAWSKGEKLSAKLFRHILPVPAVMTLISASLLIAEAYPTELFEQQMRISLLSMMLLSFAAAFVFTKLERLRTAVSDIIFPASLMVCGFALFSDNSDSASLACCAFLLAAVLMAIIGSDDNTPAAKGVRWLLSLPMVFLAVSAGVALMPVFPALEDYDNVAVLQVCLLVLFGAGFRFSGRIGLNIRTAVSDLTFVCLPVLMGFSVSYRLMIYLLISLLILTFVYERKPKRRGIILFMRLLIPFTLLMTIFGIDDRIGELSRDGVTYPATLTTLALLSALFILCDRIHKLRTPLSDFLIPIAVFITTIDRLDSTTEKLACTLLYSAALCAMLVKQGMEKDEGEHLVIHRAASSVPLFLSAIALNGLFAGDLPQQTAECVSFIITAIIAGAGAFIFCRRAAADSYESGSICTQLQYSWTAISGVLLLMNSASYPDSVLIPITAAAVSILMYILCSHYKNNIVSAVFVLTLYISGSEIAYAIAQANGWRTTGAPYAVAAAVVIAAILWCGRLLFKEQLTDRSCGCFKVDIASLGAFFAPFMVLDSTGGDVSYRVGYSIALILAAGFFANLMRPANSDKTNHIMMSLASACLCLLVYTRPFLISDDPAVNAKINLIPLLLYGVIIRRIWKDNEKLSNDLSFAVNLAALAFLMLDALMNQSIGNTILVLCVTLVIMLRSFAKRNGRWFAISAASFIGLTLYITSTFFGRAEWWVYLLGAGIVLIAVAAANEYLKSTGKSLKEVISRFSERWHK